MQSFGFSGQAVVYRPAEPADMLYCLVEGEVELSLEVHDKSLKAGVQHEESVHPKSPRNKD